MECKKAELKSMQINKNLKELRLAHNLTQEKVADYLGVSSQTVSKWERGILSPDIGLLPQIAVLYKTSIDSIFNMEFYWDEQHKTEFINKVKLLISQKDKEGLYSAYISEIELRPDNFNYYPDIMLCVLRYKMFDEVYIGRLIRLADYADDHCRNDDIRNEIHRLMLQICSFSTNQEYRKMVQKYYLQLSMLRHSREVYAKYVMSGDEYINQLRENIMRTIDIAECSIRQLIKEPMSYEERLFYYKKAAALYEIVIDDKFAGFWDIPLLCDYAEIVKLLYLLDKKEESREYIEKMLFVTERIAFGDKKTNVSVFIADTDPENHISYYTNCIKLLNDLKNEEAFTEYKKQIVDTIAALTRRENEKAGN